MLYQTLNNDVEMPMLGYGVFQTPPDETERCVSEALEVGYRLIDTAQAYGAYKAGKLRAIGVSNFYPERLIDVALLAEVPPAVNQIETHPFRQQDEAHEVMAELDVAHEAWAPFAEGQNNIFANPVLTEIGEKYGKKPGQVILRALMQKDVVVIPKSVRRSRMEENFDVFDFELSQEDLAAFAALDDGSLPRIFDHYDPKTVTWLLRDYVKNNQLAGGTLY